MHNKNIKIMNDKFIEMLTNYLLKQKEHLDNMVDAIGPEDNGFEDGRILGQLSVVDKMIKLLSLKIKKEEDGESKNNQD
jgi:hypothetical protein